MQRHRLSYQSDARIIDEELTIEIQTGRSQVGQRERIVPGRRWSDTACPPNGESVGELLRRLERGCIKATEVEEAEVETHLPVDTDQARLAFEARVRPVLGMQPVGLGARVSRRQNRRRHQWRAR